MRAVLRALVLGLAVISAGCTVAPKLQVDSGDMAVQVKAKVRIVLAIDYAADGKTLLAGSQDGRAMVWDLAGLRQVQTFSQPIGTLRAVRYLPDRKTVAV